MNKDFMIVLFLLLNKSMAEYPSFRHFFVAGDSITKTDSTDYRVTTLRLNHFLWNVLINETDNRNVT